MSRLLIEQAADEQIKVMYVIFFQRQDTSDGAIQVLQEKIERVLLAKEKLLKGLKEAPMP
jgi:hypothetical protein